MSNREGIAALLIAVVVLLLGQTEIAVFIALIGLATLIWNLLAADRDERAGRG